MLINIRSFTEPLCKISSLSPKLSCVHRQTFIQPNAHKPVSMAVVETVLGIVNEVTEAVAVGVMTVVLNNGVVGSTTKNRKFDSKQCL